MSEFDRKLLAHVDRLERRIAALESIEQPKWTIYADAKTSGNFNGDAFSTTAKTVIDLSADFSIPAGVRAVLVTVRIRDSASAANDCFWILSHENVADTGVRTYCSGLANNAWNAVAHWVDCDANGDIYYQCQASGASTLDCFLRIWGYYI
jgi:hypothetical protein